MVLAIVLTVLCGLWVKQAEIVVLATQVTESVPPIPALTALLLLVALQPVGLTLGRWLRLTRAEMLSIYIFVGVAITFSGPGIIRYWVTLLSAPFYFATPQNGLASLYRWIPSWLAVKDKAVIHRLYEGGAEGAVPWKPWLVPMLAWGAFFFLFWLCMLCMVLLVRKRWLEAERLSFPTVKLPIELTGETAGERPFLRNPVMWSGFALAALYNFSNICSAFFPSVPALGKAFDFAPMMTAQPWSSLTPFALQYRPELIGFGYLVPTDICFSIWFFYLFEKIAALIAYQFAWNFPGVPFPQEQSMGAYLLLGAWYVWQSRTDLLLAVRRFLPGGINLSANHELAWPAAGFLATYLMLVGFCVLAGMAAWVAALYLGVVLLTALVAARVRGEAGIPLIWLFPFYQPSRLLIYLFGSSALLVHGVARTLTLLAMFTFLSRGYLLATSGAQLEALRIAEEARIPRRQISALLLTAAPVGLAVAYWIHLTPYYHFGSQHLGGIWGSWLAIPEYQSVVTATKAYGGPDVFRSVATAFGAALTVTLVILRRNFIGFPFHPLGFAVATAYGSLVWWSFFVVWVIKTLVLRWGGMRLYRQTIPLFLGFALGHFFAAGIVWGLLGAFWPDAARAYNVFFG